MPNYYIMLKYGYRHSVSAFYFFGGFEIDRAYDLALRGKIEAFRNETKTRKALHLTLITTYGVKQNKYSSLVQSEVNMDELFYGHHLFPESHAAAF